MAAPIFDLRNMTFDPYSNEEIESVIRFSSAKLGVKVKKDAVTALASKCRGVPRIANRFIEKARDVAVVTPKYNGVITRACVEEMFEVNCVDNLGLTKLDRKVLKYLSMSAKPAGLVSIAQVVEEDVSTVAGVVEPWLVRLGLIVRTQGGRQITELGLKHLGESSNVYQGAHLMRIE